MYDITVLHVAINKNIIKGKLFCLSKKTNFVSLDRDTRITEE